MSNPYTSVAISGYNADPPSNDASEVASNQLDWVLMHKAKLGDPLKNLAEGINTNTANAFGKRLGTTLELKTTNYSIAAPGDQGKFFSVTGTTTITLPLVADAGDGFPVVVINNGSGTVTVDTTASELIDGSTSFTLAANDWALLTTDGSTWTAGIVRAPDTETGTFVVNWVGFTTSPTTTFNFTRIGKIVSIATDAVLTATSNSTALTSGAGEVPASLRPDSGTRKHLITVQDNGTAVLGILEVDSAGLLTMRGDLSAGGFTNSGAKGIPVAGLTCTYFID